MSRRARKTLSAESSKRLTSAYDETCTPEQVEAAVATAHAAFSDRPVRDFVPVLVERKARALLNEAHG
ncbi:three-helix bundle dimerization domain-containing protein [Streptomyces mirabilis]|uniref:three-helix bundle dimerization domain-containing protein n=1 Tax=Streptomyces mirabilis TaxID=68239 RepID=UPI00368947F7